MNAKAYIEGLFKATPGLELYDISEGTNIYDLIVKPLMQIFEDVMKSSEIASISEMRAWKTLYDVPLEYLQNIAATRGVHLSYLNKSSTLVTLRFSAPVDWDIPVGTTLNSGDSTFITRDPVSITKGILESNVDNKGLFCYHDLYVYNDDGVNLPQNYLGYMSNSPAELVSITHPAITNGVSAETHISIIEKLKAKDMAISASNANSIMALIHRHTPGVSITVVTPGDEKMKRDMVYNMIPGTIMPKQESTFIGKIRRNVITNANRAYFTCIPDGNISEEPSYDDEDEFVQGQYMAISDSVDSKAVFSTDNVMNETFTQSSERIGQSSVLCALSVDSPRLLSVEDEYKFSAGDSVNIADRTSAQPTQNGVVEEVCTYNVQAQYTVLDTSLRFASSDIIPVIEKCKLYVSHSGTTYEAYVETIEIADGEYTIELVAPLGTLDDEDVEITMHIVKLYNNLSVPIIDYSGMHVDVVNAEGLYIGEGWVKSEHGMPIGTYISENQVSVVNNELVMGTNMSEKEINVVKQVFLRYGISNMVAKIIKNTSIRMKYEINPALEWETNNPTQEMER